MPNLFSNLTECLGFSQTMISEFFKIFKALKVISSKLPIGVEIIYRPFFVSTIILSVFLIISCTPQYFNNNKEIIKTNLKENTDKEDSYTAQVDFLDEKKEKIPKKNKFNNALISNEIEVILPKYENKEITKDFINAFELSLYKKENKNIKLNINLYSNKKELHEIILNKSKPGKIFFGPLTSSNLDDVSKFCSKGVLFFSFASDKKYAKNCIFLVNFFPEDDLKTLFESFDKSSRVALLFPENDYGYYINSIIDNYATQSDSILVNRASYKNDLSNAREAIKELSNYNLRKYELERQKTILKTKNDEVSIKALKKIQKFETAGVVDFTHLILPEYSIRLLQIAPLLPFYDIDPNKVQFVGTGVWDNEIFFEEPSLQKAIFSGIPKQKRDWFFEEYNKNYGENPKRTITITYDLIGISSYIINNKLPLNEALELLNNNKIRFEGMDGRFSFKNNIITRELKVLQIIDGRAVLIE